MNMFKPLGRGPIWRSGIGRIAIIAIILAVVAVGAVAFLILQSFRNPLLGTWVCSQVALGSIANSTVSLTFEDGGRVVMSAEAYFLGSKITISSQGRYNVSGSSVSIVIPIEYAGLKTEFRREARVEGDRLIFQDGVVCYKKQ